MGGVSRGTTLRRQRARATHVVPLLAYLVLASIAGVAYGYAYHRTGNIAAPTLCHFLVDITWRGFFAGVG